MSYLELYSPRHHTLKVLIRSTLPLHCKWEPTCFHGEIWKILILVDDCSMKTKLYKYFSYENEIQNQGKVMTLCILTKKYWYFFYFFTKNIYAGRNWIKWSIILESVPLISVPCECSDQPALSLSWAWDSQRPKAFSGRQPRLIWLHRSAGWSESSLGTSVQKYIFSGCSWKL